MSTAETSDVYDAAPARPARARRVRPRVRLPRRVVVLHQVLAVLGTTRWASPPPAMRAALLRALLRLVGVALLLFGRTILGGP